MTALLRALYSCVAVLLGVAVVVAVTLGAIVLAALYGFVVAITWLGETASAAAHGGQERGR